MVSDPRLSVCPLCINYVHLSLLLYLCRKACNNNNNNKIKLGKPKVLAGKEKKSTSNPTIERVKGWRDSELRSGDSGQLVILGSRAHITWCNHVLANRGHKEKEGIVAAAAGSVPLLPRFLFCLGPSSASVPPLVLLNLDLYREEWNHEGESW